VKGLALVALVLIPAAAWAVDTSIPIMPRTPTETEKVEALRLGFILNGFSMTRHPSEGSIDLTVYRKPLDPTPDGVVRTIPIPGPNKADKMEVVVTPPPEEPPLIFPEVRPEKTNTNICRRQGKRAVYDDKGGWRCR
jgi:hypothetical protein